VDRLRRSGARAPADWDATVDAALPDAQAFWKAVKAFERLAPHGAKRRRGFAAYAPHVLEVDKRGKRQFLPLWGKDEVRQAIAGMSDGFCAYCQSTVSSSHPGARGEEHPPGHIDHHQPKSRFPSLAYRWRNYFLSCAACNVAKGDKWPRGGYVRPDKGDPGARFEFGRDGGVSARKGDRRAANTVEDFDLRRHWLTKHRALAIEVHMKLVDRLIGLPGIRVEDLLVSGPAPYREAINQNVRRAWAGARGTRRV
jgi:uncharacterized protein (TIGR02646 family)